MLSAPFPWFGGKSRVSHVVWDRLGNVPNYVEPFFGSGAVLLSRPHAPKTETVNDADALLANFWRAVSHDPEAVAEWADYPVSEPDLHARHVWLLRNLEEISALVHGDPEYYDAKAAGWWVWGICSWIGGGWCSGNGPWWVDEDGRFVDKRQLPHLGSAGQGVKRQLPQLEWFSALRDRLRNVRVCCGDWSRVCGPSVTHKHGVTGVLLDPPYSTEANRYMGCYAVDSGTVAHDVRAWCEANGDNPLMRIALCGYEGDHDGLESLGWSVQAWKAHGGMGNQGHTTGRDNAHRERIWFSPHCLQPVQQGSLFDV